MALKAELLCCVARGVESERDEYGRVPLLPTIFVNATMLTPGKGQLPTPSGPLDLLRVSSWPMQAQDVSNDLPKILTPGLLEAPVHFEPSDMVDVHAPLSPMPNCASTMSALAPTAIPAPIVPSRALGCSVERAPPIGPASDHAAASTSNQVEQYVVPKQVEDPQMIAPVRRLEPHTDVHVVPVVPVVAALEAVGRGASALLDPHVLSMPDWWATLVHLGPFMGAHPLFRREREQQCEGRVVFARGFRARGARAVLLAQHAPHWLQFAILWNAPHQPASEHVRDPLNQGLVSKPTLINWITYVVATWPMRGIANYCEFASADAHTHARECVAP